MPWRERLLVRRGEPLRCDACGAILGELVDGLALQRHGKRVSLGAILIRCDRKRPNGDDCGGEWRSDSEAARLVFDRAAADTGAGTSAAAQRSAAGSTPAAAGG